MVQLLPQQFSVYYEPFLGSGAMFFLLCPRQAELSDRCAELIDAYTGLRDGVSSVVRHLEPLRPDRKLFYSIRNRPSRGRFKRVAEFVYLNKTCWNGLYRVNSDGKFNVPYGMPKTRFIVDFPNLRACAAALCKPRIGITSCDFETALEGVKTKDLVYLDPPYVTRHNNNGFVDYNETLFSWKDQKRLAQRARRLVRLGAYVIVTNANHDEVLKLYPGFRSRTLERSSTLASESRWRGAVRETILFSPNIEP